MIYVFGTLLAVAAALIGLRRLKDVPGLADPPVFEPRNLKLHPSSSLTAEGVARLLAAMEDEATIAQYEAELGDAFEDRRQAPPGAIT